MRIQIDNVGRLFRWHTIEFSAHRVSSHWFLGSIFFSSAELIVMHKTAAFEWRFGSGSYKSPRRQVRQIATPIYQQVISNLSTYSNHNMENFDSTVKRVLFRERQKKKIVRDVEWRQMKREREKRGCSQCQKWIMIALSWGQRQGCRRRCNGKNDQPQKLVRSSDIIIISGIRSVCVKDAVARMMPTRIQNAVKFIL